MRFGDLKFDGFCIDFNNFTMSKKDTKTDVIKTTDFKDLYPQIGCAHAVGCVFLHKSSWFLYNLTGCNAKLTTPKTCNEFELNPKTNTWSYSEKK